MKEQIIGKETKALYVVSVKTSFSQIIKWKWWIVSNLQWPVQKRIVHKCLIIECQSWLAGLQFKGENKDYIQKHVLQITNWDDDFTLVSPVSNTKGQGLFLLFCANLIL